MRLYAIGARVCAFALTIAESFTVIRFSLFGIFALYLSEYPITGIWSISKLNLLLCALQKSMAVLNFELR